ncbi:MAG: hypothetical protein OER04_11335 [Cyclobacteriaceae bacterium]|nr:hypothetical protein [Cyclobacteriaceae bacterium]
MASFCACNFSKPTETSQQEPLPETIQGKWSNIDLSVIIQTQNNEDTSITFKVSPGEWEQILHIKPILTEYYEDGSYRSEYRNLNDSLIRVAQGSWEMVGDSLQLLEEQVAARYYLRIQGDTATFTGYLDWDQDGKRDDLYLGRQRRHH